MQLLQLFHYCLVTLFPNFFIPAFALICIITLECGFSCPTLVDCWPICSTLSCSCALVGLGHRLYPCTVGVFSSVVLPMCFAPHPWCAFPYWLHSFQIMSSSSFGMSDSCITPSSISGIASSLSCSMCSSSCLFTLVLSSVYPYCLFSLLLASSSY